MKNLTTFLITATVMVCCLLSCSKDGDLINPASGDTNSLKATNNGVVFTVSPSGNYIDDADNIQTALDDAVTAGPGSTVQLTAGTFYLNKGIEVEGFDGYFTGAGKDKTILTTHDKINFGSWSHQIPSLIKFRCGNISMSDMKITITDPEPCIIEDLDNFLPSVIMITGNDVNPGSEGQTAKFTCNKLKFVGGDGSTWGLNYNILVFILATWESDNGAVYPLTGGYKITNCDFKQAYWSIWTQNTGGPCIIGGDATSGNAFEETEVGVATEDVNSSYCNTSYNFFDKIHWIGVRHYQGWNVDPNTLPLTDFIANNNDIKLNSYAPGEGAFTIGIYPVDGGIFWGTCTEPKINALVSNNKIQIDDIAFAGIFGQCNSNALITNNKIWGKGVTGIVTGIWGDPVNSGWVIKGNNVQGVNAEVAPIWLGPSTRNFLVVGGSNKTNVFDEGTGNTLTGVSIVKGSPLGPQIQEAMIRKHEMIKPIRSLGKK
jgi:hypothetical protein